MTTLVPDKTRMEAYLKRGLTQQAIADEWEKDSGIRVTRPAIALAIARYGLKSNKPRPRYEDLIPWRVKTEHQANYNARMLRLESRRRKGGSLNDEELSLLESWMRRLREQNAVVTYDPRTEKGFWWVPRSEEDTDIIRRPKRKAA